MTGKFQTWCTDLLENALAFDKDIYILAPINDFTSFVFLAEGAGGESCSLECGGIGGREQVQGHRRLL